MNVYVKGKQYIYILRKEQEECWVYSSIRVLTEGDNLKQSPAGRQQYLSKNACSFCLIILSPVFWPVGDGGKE